MERAIREAHSMCTLSIIRLFPGWKQTNIARAGTDEEKAELAAWIELNKRHLSNLEAEIRAAEDPSSIATDEGWPNPKKWELVQIGDRVLGELEAAKAKIDDKTFRFSIKALQSEFDPQRDNDLQGTDARLSTEFDDLEARLNTVNSEGLDRHTYLSGKLFTKTGA